MNGLTEKQYKTRWIDIKKEIKARPLLAYLTGITIKQWNEYLYTLPPHREIDRIYDAIREDRAAKTKRVRAELEKMVGYREAKQYAKKTGVSDTSIRGIIEGKKIAAGFDLIDRLEVFIHAVNPGFELSLENPLSPEKVVRDDFDEIISSIRNISNRLMRESMELGEVAKKMSPNVNFFDQIVHPSRGLEMAINDLAELKEKIDLIYSTYIEKV